MCLMCRQEPNEEIKTEILIIFKIMFEVQCVKKSHFFTFQI